MKIQTRSERRKFLTRRLFIVEGTKTAPCERFFGQAALLVEDPPLVGGKISLPFAAYPKGVSKLLL